MTVITVEGDELDTVFEWFDCFNGILIPCSKVDSPLLYISRGVTKKLCVLIISFIL